MLFWTEDFHKNKSGSQLEKVLITKSTIEKIKLSKDSLEVVISLIDRTTPKPTEGLGNRLGKTLARTREGAVNPAAPACSSTFDTLKLGELTSTANSTAILFKMSFILAHDLLRRTHLKK